MTRDNVTEAESAQASEPQPAKAVDDQLIDELGGPGSEAVFIPVIECGDRTGILIG
ncbi:MULTISPECIES: hypothetical protein [unclassified Streptomyces]|uniref:hypothetical protein n=1 Tax=unclassified Streptomyces TaxID=2593676 RepID=UPI002E382084|nr:MULTISPECIES: hypothetical protein [unclassified Streptomyces]